MAERDSLNPYAPPTISPESARGELKADAEGMIPFDGLIDVDAVRTTDYLSLGCGLFFGLGFAGILGLSSMAALASDDRRSMPGSFVLLGAAAVTLLAVFVFVDHQRVQPLKRYRWMSGMVHGILYPDQIDIAWDAGEANLMLPKLGSTGDFANRQGRLFLIRGVACFVPAASMVAEHWRLLRRDHLPKRPPGSGKHELRNPPPPPEDALVFEATQNEFLGDIGNHRFVSTRPAISRVLTIVFLGSSMLAAMMGGTSRIESIVMQATFAAFTLCSGFVWLMREGVRRHWPLRFRRLEIWPTGKLAYGSAPDIMRWMTDDALLAGHRDGWVRLPWEAVCRAVITQHAIELWFSPGDHDAWMFERGDRSDLQWSEVIHLVRSRVPKVRLWGSVRR